MKEEVSQTFSECYSQGMVDFCAEAFSLYLKQSSKELISFNLEPEHKKKRLPKREDGYFCNACGHLITLAKHQSAQDGKHRHRFMNPFGYVYLIGIFSGASGLLPEGKPSDLFSWFEGYEWQVQLCAQCREHLGWSFDNGAHRFYGLILPKLQKKQL